MTVSSIPPSSAASSAGFGSGPNALDVAAEKIAVAKSLAKTDAPAAINRLRTIAEECTAAAAEVSDDRERALWHTRASSASWAAYEAGDKVDDAKRSVASLFLAVKFGENEPEVALLAGRSMRAFTHIGRLKRLFAGPLLKVDPDVHVPMTMKLLKPLSRSATAQLIRLELAAFGGSPDDAKDAQAKLDAMNQSDVNGARRRLADDDARAKAAAERN